MKLCYNVRRMDVSVDHPGVIANIVALPFDQVLQAIPAHARVQYGLYFVFLFAFHKDWLGQGFQTSADDRVGDSQSELDDREDWVQSGETRWKLQAVCAIANTGFNWIWAQATVGEFYRRSISGNVSSVDPY